MEKFQQLCIFLLCLLILHQCVAMPLSNQCVGETLCTYTLKDNYKEMPILPGDINTRSLATWDYQKKTDLNREPQVIFEARCQDSLYSERCNIALGLEIIPVTLRMPVLRKNLACFPRLTYYVEFEDITVACLCASTRTMEEIAQG